MTFLNILTVKYINITVFTVFLSKTIKKNVQTHILNGSMVHTSYIGTENLFLYLTHIY